MTRTSRPRLAIELLESREAPGSLTGFPGSTIRSFHRRAQCRAFRDRESTSRPSSATSRRLSGRIEQVTLTGKVTDDQPVAGDLVRITGPGIDVTAIVRDDGTFQVTVTVNAAGEVTVAARATDQAGATSDPAFTTFTP